MSECSGSARRCPACLCAPIVSLVVALASFASEGAAAAATYEEPYRPQFHYTPAQNWMNDPNGLVFHDGEYHLFYQHNPLGSTWGNMSWGHAVSRDLTTWQELPVAIPHDDREMVFSGSVVVDRDNTSGFGTAANPPMVAVYTSASLPCCKQAQSLAYSADRGRTWTKYAGNPVLDIGSTEFRDPKVFWYEPDQRWIMAVALATERRIRFYGSRDLKRWDHLSDFGPANATGGAWEVPDLFPLPVDGDPRRVKWVLMVNLNPGAVAGGSGAQYFVGEFDGVRFRAENVVGQDPPAPAGDVLQTFEGQGYGGWRATGTAFGDGPARGTLPGQHPVTGYAGSGLANSFLGFDEPQGTLTSPPFRLTRNHINFLVGGGAHPEGLGASGATAVNLLVEGQVVRTASGQDSEQLRWQSWDVSTLAGRDAQIQIVDRNSGGWGHILADQFSLADEPVRPNTIGWVDYGRDFYAALSFNDAPGGRRLAIGWMNNWDYATSIPTAPWRSAMSAVRELALRTVEGRPTLVQAPVGTTPLRSPTPYSLRDEPLTGARPLEGAEARGNALELVTELDVGTASRVGIKVRAGAGQETLVGYDAQRRELYVDRTRSGDAGFSPGFSGVHRAPLAAVEGKVRLRILVDWSSVEVFGGDGEAVITDQIFPSGDSQGVELFAEGGSARVVSLDLFRLRSIWDEEPEPESQEIVNPDFEAGDLRGWTATGTAFGAGVTSATSYGWGCCFDQHGTHHLWGYKTAQDGATGTLESAAFTLGGTGDVSLLVGGGNDAASLYVALTRASDGQVLFKATGADSERYRRVTWDASAYLGQRLKIRLVDAATGGWGHVNLDDVRVRSLARSEGVVAHWPFDEGRGAVARDVAGGIDDQVSYAFTNAAFKPPSDPLWQSGGSGQGVLAGALLFDGYSTWVTRPGGRLDTPTTGLTVEAWIAPRAFEWGDEGKLSGIVDKHDEGARQGFFLGQGRHGTFSFQAGIAGAWQALFSPPGVVTPRDRWSYLAATFDAAASELRLYLDGRLVARRPTPAGAPITPYPGSLLIGRNNQPIVINDTFAVNMFNGLIDEVKIRSRALSAAEVTGAYDAARDTFAGRVVPTPDMAMKRSRFDGDRYRPGYHFAAPGHWMNEPNAPIQIGGKYHLFYQHNQHGPYWHNISWGHAVSTDMVRWRDLPPALVPEFPSVAPDGVWSGSATRDANGAPVLFFTAGDDSVRPNQRTGLARSPSWPSNTDLPKWAMHPTPVTAQSPDLAVGAGRKVRFGEFRDPFVWRDGGEWFQLVGSGVQTTGGADVGGTALLYRSTDLVNWTYVGPLLTGDVGALPATGQIWELPVFLPIGRNARGELKHVLIVNPAWRGHSDFTSKFVWYWVGDWDRATRRFTPDHSSPRMFDYGEHFTGPAGMVDESGRSILFSLAQDRRTERAHYDAGWAHNTGLPLVLSLRPDGDLGVKPIRELASLHDTTAPLVSVTGDTSVAEANRKLAGVRGDMLHVTLELARGSATQYGLDVRRSPDGAEQTRVFHDAVSQRLAVDRTRSGSVSALTPNPGAQGGPLALGGGTLKLDVYVDRSMIEAYANDHKSITTRAYPGRADALGVQVWANGGAIVKSMEVWRMKPAF